MGYRSHASRLPRCAALGLAIALLPLPLTAQQRATGSVEGTVVDARAGAPIPGATIEASGSGLRALSDAFGRFRLPRVPVGDVTLETTRLGFARTTLTVEVAPGSATRVELRLEESAIDLDPLVVLLERTRMVGDAAAGDVVPGSAHVLGRDQLGAANAFDDVHSALRILPGVNVQDEEGYGLRPNVGLRGAGSERSSKITLMEDGVVIAPAPYASPSAYYFPTMGRMEAVEVRKGSSQIRYGPQTIGGAINLVSTSIPDRTSWTVDVAGGVDETLRLKARAGDATENLGWLVETYQIRTDGFKEMEGGRDTGFEIGDYLAKLRVNTDRDARTYQELELKLSFTDEMSRETYLGLTSADFEVNPLRRYAASQADVMDAEHTQVQLRHFVRPSRAIDVTTTAYRNDFGRNWYKLQSVAGRGASTVLNDPETYARELGILRGADSGPGELRVRANNREYFAQGVQSVLGVRGSTGALDHDLEIGVRLHEDQEDRFQHEDAYQMLGGTMVRTESGAPGSQANRVSDARAAALYLQDRVRVGEWTVSPGIRYENVDFTRTDYETTDPERTAPKAVKENGIEVLIPGVGVSWEVTPAAHLFGGVHRGFSPPGPGAAAETEPEESVSYELGGRYRARGVALQATAFLSDYSNILGRATLATGESGSGDLYNGGEVDVSGVELSLDVDPAWGTELPVRLPVRLAYTLTRAEFGTAFESAYEPWGTVEVGDELPYIPEHQLSGSVGVEGSDWTVALSGFGSTAMRAVAGQGPIEDGKGTDGFAVLSLSAEYVLPRGGTIYGSIQNLFDDAYVAARRPAGARPGLPRTLLVGYRLSR